MGAAVIGIIEKERVAGREIAVACDLVDDGLYCESHGADEDRQAGGSLHQRSAGLGMVEAVAGVVGFRDDRVEGGTIERCVHLLGDLDEAAVEHRKGDGIERFHLGMLDFLSATGVPDVSKRLPRAIMSGVPMRSLSPSKSSM